jgi:SAM-dependent methyltransferase
VFLVRRGVPVHQNVLFDTPQAARAIARGDLEMSACADCGFVFNAAFDPTLVDYGPNYENTQDCSPAFNSHLDALADHIVTACGVHSGRVVEVGCGKGGFLRKLLAHPGCGCDAVGFDPSYLGPLEIRGGRARFVRDFYGPGTAVPADAVTCRHVIEHIPSPLELLRTVRAGAGASGGTRVFFETPCAEWILRNRVPWDFFYEHCSLFTAGSLTLALERAGFAVSGVRHLFGGQYLWAEGRAPGADRPSRGRVPETVALARALAADERVRRARWDELLAEAAARGPVYAWGAGAKGVTFGNLADPDRTKLAGVVDVNPAKQGKYLSGTGHPIVPPEAAAGAAAVLVFNPNYLAEIRHRLATLSPLTDVIDPMQEAAPCSS